MKILVNSMKPSWSDVDKLEMGVEFTTRVQKTGETISIFADFDSNGNVDTFPSLSSVGNNPYYYIDGGKLMELLVNFQGDKAKSLYSKVMKIYNKYEKEIEEIQNSKEFKDAKARKFELDSKVSELRDKLKRARKEEKIEEYEALIYKTQKEKREIEDTIISCGEEKMKTLSLKRTKEIREIEVNL